MAHAKRPLALLALLSLLGACDGDLDSSESSLEGAVIVPDCSLEGDFVVELGEDRDGFALISADEEPTLHFGAQGGTHLILAARVVTPDPLDKYQVTLLAEIGQEPCSGGDCSTFATIGQISRSIEGASQVHLVAAGEVEIPSLFLVVENWSAAPVRRLTLEITDACERGATTVRTFVAKP